MLWEQELEFMYQDFKVAWKTIFLQIKSQTLTYPFVWSWTLLFCIIGHSSGTFKNPFYFARFLKNQNEDYARFQHFDRDTTIRSNTHFEVLAFGFIAREWSAWNLAMWCNATSQHFVHKCLEPNTWSGAQVHEHVGEFLKQWLACQALGCGWSARCTNEGHAVGLESTHWQSYWRHKSEEYNSNLS